MQGSARQVAGEGPSNIKTIPVMKTYISIWCSMGCDVEQAELHVLHKGVTLRLSLTCLSQHSNISNTE